MKKLIFITGGAISGKSTFALQILENEDDVSFIATGQVCDKEMKEKIKNHKKERSKTWETIEVNNQNIEDIIKNINKKFVIIDCLTFYVSTQLIKNKNDRILDSAKNIVEEINKNKNIKKCIIVSNEVGMGIVPNNELSRNFREILGNVNKIFMKNTNKAYFMVSGYPLKLK
ncbi:MAG: bifunctional adenosylcobinamide kinase/adenosylcobinamide-phosphate guanylyltransferase [Candidatus Pacebacteria bacterium]|nr:bifunctional adenosylcobinamide kinase/adenosylcobinamide-phosphate guanylyltransferase [Candidatus Paceibacterota bacterium]